MKLKNDFVSALLKEVEITGAEVASSWGPVETVYIGGGTPSLLPEIAGILDEVRRVFPVSPGAEVTLEANPDDINEVALSTWRAAGVNRLSIGVQSFFDDDLRWMNRAHNAEQAESALRLALSSGFDVTIDLIYGHPTLTDERWRQNVEKAVTLGVAHLSCYALTVEPHTPLYHLTLTKKVLPVDPEKQASQFLMLMEWMKHYGFGHYEISNFALPGKESRHNSAYWQGKKYLGLGPSAHSFDGGTRWWNVSNNVKYIGALKAHTLPREFEVLTPQQRLNEYIMTAIRTKAGIDLAHLRVTHGEAYAQQVLASAEKYRNTGKMLCDGQSLQLTDSGKLFADGIASDLFVVE